MTTFWTYVAVNREDLEALTEADLPFELHERMSQALAAVIESLEGLERAKRISERLAWVAEMNRLMEQEP
jgi:hypothetical protein